MYTLQEIDALLAESESAYRQALANVGYQQGRTETLQQMKAKMLETQAGTNAPDKPAKEGKD